MIYTSVLNRIVLSYSKTWILPLALVALGLFLALVFRFIREGRDRRGRLCSRPPVSFSSQL